MNTDMEGDMRQPYGLACSIMKIPRPIRLWIIRSIRRAEFRLNGRAKTIRRLAEENERLAVERDALKAMSDQRLDDIKHYVEAYSRAITERGQAREAAITIWVKWCNMKYRDTALANWPWLAETPVDIPSRK